MTKTVKNVSSHEFVRNYAAHLKRSGKIEPPVWADLVKTATLKELASYDADWYHIRTGRNLFAESEKSGFLLSGGGEVQLIPKLRISSCCAVKFGMGITRSW